MLKLEVAERVAVLTLTNPPANTFTAAGLLQLQQYIGELDRNSEVSAIVVTGAGDKFFSAGADLKSFAAEDFAYAHLMAQRFGAAFETLQEARAVVIAAINGYAMGGGLECALACDIRIAEEHAQMALPEPAVGLLPCGCGTQTLPWLVGEGWAKRMILTNQRVDAATALRIGLIEEVVARGSALSTALGIAKRVTELSPEAVSYSKQLIHLGRQGVPRTAALAMEREKFMTLFATDNRREGVTAFLEKRAPQWQRGT
jgi:enoyl-CoA hydratase/carnithine racemase